MAASHQINNAWGYAFDLIYSGVAQEFSIRVPAGQHRLCEFQARILEVWVALEAQAPGGNNCRDLAMRQHNRYKRASKQAAERRKAIDQMLRTMLLVQGGVPKRQITTQQIRESHAWFKRMVRNQVTHDLEETEDRKKRFAQWSQTLEQINNDGFFHSTADAIIQHTHDNDYYQAGKEDDAGGLLPMGLLVGSYNGVWQLSMDRIDNDKPHYTNEDDTSLATFHSSALG